MLFAAVDDRIVPYDIVLGDAARRVASADRKADVLIVIDKEIVLGNNAFDYPIPILCSDLKSDIATRYVIVADQDVTAAVDVDAVGS